MNEFKIGDNVVHLLTREEGVVKNIHIMRSGTNTFEVLLVQTGTAERLWLPHETELIKTTL